MENPSIRLARALEARMARHAAGAVQGLAGELGTITKVFKGDPFTVKRVWVKLDNFKDIIKDAMFADFKAKVVIPDFARMVRIAACPVDPGVLTRFDFDVEGVVDSEGARREETTVEVEIRFKDGLEVGDRVLVIPFNRGQDHLIACKVKPADGEGCGGCGGCGG